jgi:hypothetical protein
LQAEEALGYLVEQNPNMPIAKRFLAWFRAQVRRLAAPLKGAEKLRFIKWATDLTADDLIYMATAATREVTSMPTAQQDTRKSSKQPTTIEIDGKPIAPAVRDNQGRLLAPNGQPSKLNERQWHQVRTSEFKAWFGDWEAAASEFIYQRSSPIIVDTKYGGDLASVRTAALADYHAMRKANREGLKAPALNGKTQHGEQGLVLLESNEKFASKTGDKRKFQIIGKLVELLNNAVWYGFEPPKKASQLGNVAGYHYLVSKAKIDGLTFDVAFAVREDNNGNFHHNHTLYRESEAQAPWVALEEGSQVANTAVIASDDLSLYRPRPKINTEGISKVVDENGEPLVVYHGTPFDFSSFDPSKTFDGGLYFTPDVNHAEEFGEMWGTRRNAGGVQIMPVHLSIKNPLEIDAEGLPFDQSWQERLEEEIHRGKQTGQFDGIVVRNLDALGYGNESDMWIAFSPTQIKSAPLVGASH